MAFVLTIDSGNGPVDYTQYVSDQSISITDSINVPTTFQFGLNNNDNTFVVPVRNAYVALYSTNFGKNLVTGFITNTPDVAMLGVAGNVPKFNNIRFQYTIKAASDEWLLNMKAVPMLPVFINQTQGQILASLAQTLAPDFYDTSGIQAGMLIPSYTYDPTQKWSDIAKTFGDSARYRYQAIGKKLVYAPFGDDSLGIAYDETKGQGTFDPYGLATQVMTVPPVNDAIVIGDVEPQNNFTDYFIGDGLTASFPLRHAVFHGSTDLLLEDDWTEGTFSTSNWNVVDPQGQFQLAGALNVVGASGAIGSSYIAAANGVELGGMLTLQHGSFFFTDTCTGLVGGLYSEYAAGVNGSPSTLPTANCIAAFNLSPSGSVVATASGAAGIVIQPLLGTGGLVGPKFVTKLNHHYILGTIINCAEWSRYNQAYSTLVGTVFGNYEIDSTVDITFTVGDVDLSNPVLPVQTNYQYTVSGVTVPSFALYALVVPQFMNCAISFTLLSQPPQGQLTVAGLSGASGTNLPPKIVPPALTYQMGFGALITQPATIQQIGQTDNLAFYSDSVPSAGAKIVLQTWEEGGAIARVQDPLDIAAEALIDGDDGLRTAILSDLTPLPRTTMECETAAQATIADRVNVQYDGSYTVMDYFWNGSLSDYPRTGRYLTVNSPARSIVNQNFFVRTVTTTVLELWGEKLQFVVSFGQDLYVAKLLARFLPHPTGILTSQDKANPPDAQQTAEVGTIFLPMLSDAQASHITGTTTFFDLGMFPVSGCEVRTSDFGWGQPASQTRNLLGVFTSQTFSLPRTQYDQTYYLRQVNGSQISRWSKAIHIVQPLIPTSPIGFLDVTDPNNPSISLQLTGDIRNIMGVEIRGADNATVLYQARIFSQADLAYEYSNNSFPATLGLTFYCYFVNMLWEYSPPLALAETLDVFLPANSLGPNMIGNPSFEVESFQYVQQTPGNVPVTLADGWSTIASSAQFLDILETGGGFSRTGSRDALLRLSTGQIIGASGLVQAAINYPLVAPFGSSGGRVGIPIRGGQWFYFGGYAGWWENASFPGGINGLVEFGLIFYDTNGNYITAESTGSTNNADITAPTNEYTFLDGFCQAPDNAAFAFFQCYAQAQSTLSSPFSTSGNLYMDARFDDVFFENANRGSHATYRPTTNPLTGHDAGSNATINIANFIMRSGSTDSDVDSGSITSLSYGTLYYIYYDDPAFLGGPVMFEATTIKEIALLGENRFFVGSITTPISGAPDTVGNNDGGAGGQTGSSFLLGSASSVQGIHVGAATASNLTNLLGDGRAGLFAEISAPGTSGANGLGAFVSGFPAVSTGQYSQLSVVVDWQGTDSLVGSGFSGATITWVNAITGDTATPIAYPYGTANFSRMLTEFAVPANSNLSQLTIKIVVATNSSATGGTVDLKIYRVYIVGLV